MNLPGMTSEDEVDDGSEGGEVANADTLSDGNFPYLEGGMPHPFPPLQFLSFECFFYDKKDVFFVEE